MFGIVWEGSRVDFTRIWLACVSRDFLVMQTGGFQGDLLSVVYFVLSGNDAGWMSLRFGCNDCLGISWQW